jgi:outer membrane protein assembly factor BamB
MLTTRRSIAISWLVSSFALATFAAPASPPAFDPATEWHQWRGPKRDGHSADTGLLKSWPPDGPPLVWKARGFGAGYSGASFAGNCLFTMGDVDKECRLLALDRATGKPIWSARVGPPGGGEGYPGPRCTPATDGTRVVALGQFGDLICAEAETGKILWKKNLEKDFDGEMMSGWGYSESPLIDGPRVVCTPGGSKGTLLALDKTTGAVIWRTSGVTDAAAYSSAIVAEIGGVRQYLQLTGETLFGADAGTGKVLWRVPRHGETAVVTTPVYRDGVAFVTSAYGAGGHGFRIESVAGQCSAKEIYAVENFENQHGGVVLVGDHVYGMTENRLVCMEFKSGKIAWKHPGVGKGSIAFADGRLIVRGERKGGTVALVEANPQRYVETGRFDQPDRSEHNSWPHPVIAGGRLYLRDQDVLLCYDLRAR